MHRDKFHTLFNVHVCMGDKINKEKKIPFFLSFTAFLLF